MAYDKAPAHIRSRFLPDGTVLPAEPLVLVWPTIAWLVGTREVKS